MKKLVWFIKSILHFIYVLLTPYKMHKYKLKFVKEDGFWFIDLPYWPFDRNRLLMVAGADTLCDEFSDNGKDTIVNVITSNDNIHYYESMVEDRHFKCVKCIKDWAYLKWGGQYHIPEHNFCKTREMWICQVTLFVLGWWPKFIYIYKD